ncbi:MULTISPECIES: LysR family transcriptional regulator [unclassified Shewanella]|jgi:DNA-binding transcriptional LysR family regulator|uniref:LysR family transcriptional regulator n=1 Tax=unclassified Shewanella TaxID=196818 RepID=UPI000C31DA7A|nr:MULTISPECIES: LysR family transcriptional regulator [unclassified Shewanella]MBB1361633.1 LysR family transcriptional regulator [Shewanella sp. SR44-4]MBO1896804.1 LysR family transcriptional regulator [Shewanella sp. BF02_Schw]PKH29316.1 LysR family transcriptional regulator [Shewanella sp. ALD9]
MLNQQWLTTFIKLVEVGHFTHTAEQLFMTQPGVSQHIKKLELQVGVDLLIRIGKSFELTEAGIVLYQQALVWQQQQQQVLSQLAVDDEHVGVCRLACSGSMALLLYPHLIDYQLPYSQLQIHLEAAPNKRIIDSVMANTVDVGIITQPINMDELVVTPLAAQSLCLVLPQSYPHQSVTFEQLMELGMVSHPDAMHYWSQIVGQYFIEKQVLALQVPIRSYVNQLNQILVPVAKGLAFAVLPQFAVDNFAQQQHIRIASFATEQANNVVVSEPLFIIYKKHRPLARRYGPIINKIKQLVK